jgi:hypothetical protein
MIDKSCPAALRDSSSDEIVIDLDLLNNNTLCKIETYVKKCLANAKLHTGSRSSLVATGDDAAEIMPVVTETETDTYEAELPGLPELPMFELCRRGTAELENCHRLKSKS